jgi:hypothetical protein
MNILIIAAPDFYRDASNKNYNSLLEYYKKNSINNITITWTDKRDRTILNDKYDIIIFFDIDTIRFGLKFKQLFNRNIPICSSSIDYFYLNQCVNCKYINKCDAILFLYKSKLIINSYKNAFPNKIICNINSRYINTEIFQNYNLNKQYDILIYGNRNHINKIEEHYPDQEYKKKWEDFNNKKLDDKHYFYPLRIRIEKLLLKNKHKYNLLILPNSGGIGCKPKYANKKLAELINQSYLCLATSSRADILMHKYLEISASYSTILGNIPSDCEDLFKDNIVEINEWMSDDEILEIIDNALADKNKLLEISKKLGDIVHNEHNLDYATKDFDTKFKYIVEKYNNIFI